MTTYELSYACLSAAGRALSFPCDAQGRVDMDVLSEHALQDYLYARAVVGHEFSAPLVRACNAC